MSVFRREVRGPDESDAELGPFGNQLGIFICDIFEGVQLNWSGVAAGVPGLMRCSGNFWFNIQVHGLSDDGSRSAFWDLIHARLFLQAA